MPCTPRNRVARVQGALGLRVGACGVVATTAASTTTTSPARRHIAHRLIIDHARLIIDQVLTSTEVLAVHKMDEEPAAVLSDLRRGVRRRV